MTSKKPEFAENETHLLDLINDFHLARQKHQKPNNQAFGKNWR
jgi:hypothetical protein